MSRRTIIEALKPLRFRGNDLIVMHVLDPAEIDFGFDQASSFEDMESGEQIPVVPSTLADQYRALVKQHIATLQSRLTENRIDYAHDEHVQTARLCAFQLPGRARATDPRAVTTPKGST